jgi:hypothetical protein
LLIGLYGGLFRIYGNDLQTRLWRPRDHQSSPMRTYNRCAPGLFVHSQHVVCTVNMPPKINEFWEGYVTDAKYSYSAIIAACKTRKFIISKKGISAVVNRMGKSRDGRIPAGKKQANPRPSTSRTTEVVGKVRQLVRGRNPATQRAIANKVGVSVGTVNAIINKNLNLEKRHKSRVHKLLPRHIAERKTNCRKLYERYLAGDRWKYVATLDEAWIYLSDCNKPRAIFYRPRGVKPFETWYKECKETFSKGFMVVAGYCHNGKLEIRRVAKNTKINSTYYQTNVLAPLFTQEIPNLYGVEKNKVWLHQDKASSHTSKTTRKYLREMEETTGIRSIPFEDIPVKSPDASPMDFCGFGLLKRALGRRRPRTVEGLWKACQQEWMNIDLAVLQRSLLHWKIRCRAIVHQQGHQIEHNRWWRNGL